MLPTVTACQGWHHDIKVSFFAKRWLILISSVFARLLYRELSGRGFNDERILHRTGLSVAQLWSAPALPNEGFLQFLRNTRELVAPEPVGFLVATLHRAPTVNMTGMAMTSAPTLRDGLQAMASYSVLAAEYVRIEVRAGRQEAQLVLNFEPLIVDCRDIHTEAVLLLMQSYLESIMGTRSEGMRFSVALPAPEHAELYDRYLHGPVKFDQDRDAIHFPAYWLDTLSPFADPDLWTMSRQHLAAQLERAMDSQLTPFTRHLRAYLAAHTPPLPELQETAESLHLSTRTLNRRLSAEGTTFRQLRLENTHEWARRLLKEGISVEAVALQLGYDNPANFRRSFRSMNGVSPSVWLQQQSAPVSEHGPDA